MAFSTTVSSRAFKAAFCKPARAAVSARRSLVTMGASAGDAVPAVTLYGATPGDEVKLADYVKGKTVIVFGVPGAFTPGCSKTHLPGYISMADDFKAAGVDEIICTSVNDPFVMTAWGEASGAAGKVTMLADTQMELTKALDIELDAAAKLGNARMKRFSMIVKDDAIKQLNIEADGAGLACSLADVAMEQIKAM